MLTIHQLRHQAAELLDELVNTNAADPPDSTSLKQTLAVVDALEAYFMALPTGPRPYRDPPPPGPPLHIARHPRNTIDDDPSAA